MNAHRHERPLEGGVGPHLLGAAEIRELAAHLDVTPTKKLGQNFVHDANTVRKIVSTAGVQRGETVLEIGPGLGSLTLGLLEAGADVVAVEIDPRLAEQLPHTAALLQPGTKLDVVVGDALRVTELPAAPVKVVANLPYNVSVPVLLHLLEHFDSLASGIVMVQAEVGERLAAAPGSKVYGAPSAKAAWYGDWRLAGNVSRTVFWPVPNVDSVLVGFARTGVPGSEAERRETFALIDGAFGQRRKMLRQSLSGLLGGSSAAASEVLESAGVDPQSRGESLTVEDFLGIARAAAAAGVSVPVTRGRPVE
ncbi:16S rRNA (adenine(1518)-N(6)/adenine(1519)-N(6))-dimethyltransferase RsmA [Agromyces seonyuensis]|uniref:Ribosomal RNA small subunit methyltransferase A n=1 Tax=Agromyces seonyuensis TaxID=2662446 RepID=A0A6I4P633_9MICO|nr:16S rRNA (adenine(1518)-N(6)/adenine(1519)-N(6))-dimethyltransferase RsmA [Agromyces seonyuensis]MWB99004.1 16S rRNA (adenine(1518)-N(6)/adenine(1519)-N(6))-dimethyltransferase RsmA [Agromyces seonyuensis]